MVMKKYFVSIMLLLVVAFGGNVATAGEELSGIDILRQNKEGIPVETMDSGGNYNKYTEGMFCLPKLKPKEACISGFKPVIFRGESYADWMETLVTEQVNNLFTLIITGVMNKGGDKSVVYNIRCLFDKEKETTIKCGLIPPIQNTSKTSGGRIAPPFFYKNRFVSSLPA